jgi:hypothetical protein
MDPENPNMIAGNRWHYNILITKMVAFKKAKTIDKEL